MESITIIDEMDDQDDFDEKTTQSIKIQQFKTKPRNGKFVLLDTKDSKFAVYNERFKSVIGRLSNQ